MEGVGVARGSLLGNNLQEKQKEILFGEQAVLCGGFDCISSRFGES